MGRLLGALGALIASCILAFVPVTAAETITYTYDALGRLIEVSSSGDVNDGVVASHAYDDAGNRTVLTVTGTEPSFSIQNVSVTEGGDLIFTVTRAGATAPAVSVDFGVAAGTATSGTDYTPPATLPGTLSFASEQTSQTITISTINDTIAEADETLTVTLSNPTGGAVITGAAATGTIIDNDTPGPAISISDAIAFENGSNEADKLVFTVTLSVAHSQTVTVGYATVDGTATAPSDYASQAGTLTFTAGQTSKTITVSTNNNGQAESTETIAVTLSSSTGGATILDGSGAGTIYDDDGSTSFSITDATITEGGALTFSVVRSGPTQGSRSVSYATVNGTALAGSDYTTASGTLSFQSGGQAPRIQTVTVSTIDDSAVESTETMSVVLSNPSNGATISDDTGIGTILDNDVVSDPLLSVSDTSVAEGGNLVFTVTRSGDVSAAVGVNYATSNGTATAGSDYTASSGALSFAASETTKTVIVATTNDSTPESSETVLLTLSSPTGGAVIVDGSATGTITDNDQPVDISVADASVTEGGNLSFTVTLSQASSGAVTVGYGTSNGSATAGSDYTAASGTVSFAAGETSKSVTVATTDDSTVEAAETVILTLSAPTGNASILDGTATGTINDNDVSAQISIANASATEGNNLSFTVTLSAAAPGTVTVNYATSNGTATSGSDYTATSGTLTYTVGQTSKSITVPTINNTIYELAETMTVTLSSPTGGAAISVASATGTINDNDTPPSFSISDASATEGSNLTFTVTKSGSTAVTTAVSYATSNGTAAAGSDYTATSGSLSFTSSQTSKTISVTTTDDSSAESNETMTVNLSSPTNGSTISDGSGTGTINDNDTVTYIQITDGVVNVYSAHQSTYGCELVSFPEYGIGWQQCWLTSNSVMVYYGDASGQQFDPGYSWSSGLRVLSNYYGTGQ